MAGLDVKILRPFHDVFVGTQIVDANLSGVSVDGVRVKFPRNQEHGDKTEFVQEFDYVFDGDGLYTDTVDMPVGVKVADCLPILFYNTERGLVGAIHAGWRGTQKDIVLKCFSQIMADFQVSPTGFYVFLGLAAQTCCYERDFVGGNIFQIESMGIPNNHIENSGICTIHNTYFPSHRREGKSRKTALLAFIGKN